MSIICQSNQINYPGSLAENLRQVNLETQLKLSVNSPRIAKIINGKMLLGTPEVRNVQGMVIVSGKVQPSILYLGEEGITQTETEGIRVPREYVAEWQEAEISYEESFEFPDLDPEAKLVVNVNPMSCFYDQAGAERINFYGRLEIKIISGKEETGEILTDIAALAPEKVNATKETVKLVKMNEFYQTKTNIETSLLLPKLKPGIARVLELLVNPVQLQGEVTQGRSNLKGLLEISLIYVGCDDEGQPTEVFVNDWNRQNGTAIPFEVAWEDGRFESGTELLPQIRLAGLYFESISSHELGCYLELDCQAQAIATQKAEIVVSVTPESNQILDLKKGLLSFQELVETVDGEIPLDLNLELPLGATALERQLAINAQLHEIKTEVVADKLVVHGFLDLKLWYITEGDAGVELAVAAWESRKNNSIPISGEFNLVDLVTEAMIDWNLEIESLELEVLETENLHLKGLLKLKALTQVARSMVILQDCALVNPVDPNTRPSMLFYIAQPGDTLWQVARAYQTTVASLAQVNQLDENSLLQVGQKLLIPKLVS